MDIVHSITSKLTNGKLRLILQESGEITQESSYSLKKLLKYPRILDEKEEFGVKVSSGYSYITRDVRTYDTVLEDVLWTFVFRRGI